MTKMFSVPCYTIYIACSIPISTILAACMNVYFCVSYIYYLRSILDQILLDYSYHISKIILKVLLRLIIILHVLIFLTFLFRFYPHLSATNFFVTTRVIKMTKESSRLNILLRLGTIICQFENAF